MRFSLFFALRYLFSRTKMGAINWVSGISAVAIAVVTAALVCVLSVFNGYVAMILDGTESSSPDLMIVPRSGQTIDLREPTLGSMLSSPEVELYSLGVRSQAVLSLGGTETMVQLLGVDDAYTEVVPLEHKTSDVRWVQHSDSTTTEAILGARLGLSVQMPQATGDTAPTAQLILPRREGLINPLIPARAFITEPIEVIGLLYSISESIDQTVIISIERLREILSYDDSTASYCALSINPGVDIQTAIRQLSELDRSELYDIRDREAQQPELTFLIKAEKLMIYVVMIFILLLAAFSLASSIVMLMLEKQVDLSVLTALGATARQRSTIFALTGLLISAIGIVVGIALGLILCFVQERWGLLYTGAEDMPMPFPIAVELADIGYILAGAVIITALVTLLPSIIIKQEANTPTAQRK